MKVSTSKSTTIILAVLCLIWLVAFIGCFFAKPTFFAVFFFALCASGVYFIVKAIKVLARKVIVYSYFDVDEARQQKDLVPYVDAAEKYGALEDLTVYRDKDGKILEVKINLCEN